MTLNIYDSLKRLEKYKSFFKNVDSRFDFHYVMFDQIWPSTALGFNCIGGDAMTIAPTMVIFEGTYAHIFFNGLYCYSCERNNDKFVEDLHNRYLKTFNKAQEIYGATTNDELVKIRDKRK